MKHPSLHMLFLLPQIRNGKSNVFFSPPLRYWRLAPLQVGGCTWSLFQPSYSIFNSLSFKMARNLKTRKDSCDLSTFPTVRSSFASWLRFNVGLFTSSSTMEIRWQQKPHSGTAAQHLGPCFRGQYETGAVNLWTSYKLLKILNKALERRYACRERPSSVWDPTVKENGCEQPVSNWLSKTRQLHAFIHFVP